MPARVLALRRLPRHRRAVTTWAQRAVLVIHGIGLQRRGDTSAALVRALRLGARLSVQGPLAEPTRFGEPVKPAPLRLTYEGRAVDLYELYWAPRAAHKTTARAVLGWLVRATFLPGAALKRPSAKTVYDIALVLGALVLAAALALATLMSLGNLTAAASCAVDRAPACEQDPARELSGEEVTLQGPAQLGAALRALRRSVRLNDRPFADLTVENAADVLRSVPLGYWLALLAILYVSAQLLYRAQQVALAVARGSWRRERLGAQLGALAVALVALFALAQFAPPVLIAFVWVLAIAWVLRRAAARFLAESLGDVQVYVEQDENSEYFATRRDVLAAGEEVMAAIEERGYADFVVIGHSLGSQIGLDLLRRLLTRNVFLAQRLTSFVTFGTAIEKVRYFFARRADDPGRLARTLIAEREAVTLPAAWVNLWYLNDPVANPISGGARLSFDQAAGRLGETFAAARAGAPVNLSLGWGLRPLPLWPHSAYWVDPRCGRVFLEACFGPGP